MSQSLGRLLLAEGMSHTNQILCKYIRNADVDANRGQNAHGDLMPCKQSLESFTRG